MGDVGVYPGTAITGFPPGVITAGSLHPGDAAAQAEQTSVTCMQTTLSALPCGTDLSGQDLGGKTLTPGVYCFTSSAQLTGMLTLNAQGDPNALFVFKIATTFTSATSSSVISINGMLSASVFWLIGTSATLGTGTQFIGNVVAQVSITLNTNAIVHGRLLTKTGAITLDTADTTRSDCPNPITTGATTSSVTTGFMNITTGKLYTVYSLNLQ